MYTSATLSLYLLHIVQSLIFSLHILIFYCPVNSGLSLIKMFYNFDCVKMARMDADTLRVRDSGICRVYTFDVID